MTDETLKLPIETYASTIGDIQLNNLSTPWLIVYFYPKDSTPGCTVQAVDFSTLKSEFEALNAQVIGVSRDSIKKHQNFTEKQSLTIPLISDESEQLCQHFDVIKEKNMYGKKVMGIERSTFIFHQQKLVKSYRKVKAANHALQVLNDLKALQNI